MRGRGAIFACAGLALLASGCDKLDGRYTREGIGTELYTPEVVDGARLQELYVGYICQQAGLAFGQDGESLTCREPPVSRSWGVFVQAGMNDIDRRCDGYLTWLDNRRRWIGPIHQQLLDTEGATLAIIAATVADPTKSIAVVAAAFGLASHSFTNFNNRFLFEVEKSTVQTVVLTRQQNYRNDLSSVVVDNRPAAIYALRQYLRLCMPMTIETQINTTVKLFERGGTIALNESKANPMINAKTVRTAVIQKANAPIPRPFRAPIIQDGVRIGDYEGRLAGSEIRGIQAYLCLPPDGKFTAGLRTALISHLKSMGEKDPSLDDRITKNDGDFVSDELRSKRTKCKPS